MDKPKLYWTSFVDVQCPVLVEQRYSLLFVADTGVLGPDRFDHRRKTAPTQALATGYRVALAG